MFTVIKCDFNGAILGGSERRAALIDAVFLAEESSRACRDDNVSFQVHAPAGNVVCWFIKGERYR